MPSSPQSSTRKDLFTENDPNSYKQGINGYGVYSGLAVSPGTGLQVSVAAGSAYFSSTRVTKSSPTLVTISTADISNPRRDIIVMDSSGTISAIAGTPAISDPAGDTRFQFIAPYPPAVPTGSILLAEVYVAALGTSLLTSDILDKRVLLDRLVMRPSENILLWQGNSLDIYDASGTTLLFRLDNYGNLYIKGIIQSL